MSNERLSLLVITGPTGVGKTSLAIGLADEAPLSLISADSVMVYQGLDIGSAKPLPAELERYPHALVDLVPPEQKFDAGQFVQHARESIVGCIESGRIPCLVGGTILYLKALLDGLHDMPGSDPIIRANIRSEASKSGWPAVHSWLARLDPLVAKEIHPNHSSRIERALEVVLLTGQSIRAHWKTSARPLELDGKPVDIRILVLLPEDRTVLKTALDQRFEQMIKQGLLGEVVELKKRPGLTEDCSSIRSVGYRQVWQYLDGRVDYQTMCDQAKAATRQLAKRQLTWLRSWRSSTNTFIEVANSIPIESGRRWLGESLTHVL